MTSVIGLLALLARPALACDLEPVRVVSDFSILGEADQSHLERGLECVPDELGGRRLSRAPEELEKRLLRCQSDKDCFAAVARSDGAAAILELRALKDEKGGVLLQSRLLGRTGEPLSPPYQHPMASIPEGCSAAGAEVSRALMPHASYVPRLPWIVAEGSSQDEGIVLYRVEQGISVGVVETRAAATLRRRPSCTGVYEVTRKSAGQKAVYDRFEVKDDGTVEVRRPTDESQCSHPNKLGGARSAGGEPSPPNKLGGARSAGGEPSPPNKVALLIVGGEAPHVGHWLAREFEEAVYEVFPDVDTFELDPLTPLDTSADEALKRGARGLLVVTIDSSNVAVLVADLSFQSLGQQQAVTIEHPIQIARGTVYGELAGRRELVQTIIPKTKLRFEGSTNGVTVDGERVDGQAIVVTPGCHKITGAGLAPKFVVASFERESTITVESLPQTPGPSTADSVAGAERGKRVDKRIAFIAAGGGVGAFGGPLLFLLAAAMGGVSLNENTLAIGAAVGAAILNPIAVGLFSSALPSIVAATATLVDFVAMVGALAPAFWYVADHQSEVWVAPVAALGGSIVGMALAMGVGAAVWPSESAPNSPRVRAGAWGTPEGAGMVVTGSF
ncbi:MAG: hypothetical protein U0271_03820 [Polyangiaceae bacterium]